MLSFLEAIFFSFIEQIRLATAEIDDLRAAVSILLQQGALLAVVRVRNAGASADHASSLVRAVVALVTDSNQRAGPHVRIADHAFTVALLAEAAFANKRERDKKARLDESFERMHRDARSKANGEHLPIATPGCFLQKIRSG